MNALSQEADLPNAFDPSIDAELGIYVYALVDPESNEVFYVGKGKGRRVLSHAKLPTDAIDPSAEEKSQSDKHAKIHSLKTRGLSYKWYVVARNLADDKTALLIESALIFVLNNCRNKGLQLTNIVKGSFLDMHGGASQETVTKWRAAPPQPKSPYSHVLVFNISKALDEGKSPYEATRAAWANVSKDFRSARECLAVGLQGGYSRCVIKIDAESWSGEPNTGKTGTRWSFTGVSLKDHELLEKNWKQLVAQTGYWLLGNYLGVEFDGNGNYRFSRGSKDKNWKKVPVRVPN